MGGWVRVATYFVGLFTDTCQDLATVLFKQEVNIVFGSYFSTNTHVQMYANIPEEHGVTYICSCSAVKQTAILLHQNIQLGIN